MVAPAGILRAFPETGSDIRADLRPALPGHTLQGGLNDLHGGADSSIRGPVGVAVGIFLFSFLRYSLKIILVFLYEKLYYLQ